MKKHLKLLVLVLSLALIIGAVAIVASADNGNVCKIGDKEYATVKEALKTASSGATITLIKDTILDEAIGNVDGEKKSYTLNLNGYTLTTNVANAIQNHYGYDIRIIGEGEIVCNTGSFISNNGSKVGKFSVIGSGNGIKLTAKAGTVATLGKGTLLLENVYLDIKSASGGQSAFNLSHADSGLTFENCFVTAWRDCDAGGDRMIYYGPNVAPVVNINNTYIEYGPQFFYGGGSDGTIYQGATINIENSYITQKFNSNLPAANQKVITFNGDGALTVNVKASTFEFAYRFMEISSSEIDSTNVNLSTVNVTNGSVLKHNGKPFNLGLQNNEFISWGTANFDSTSKYITSDAFGMTHKSDGTRGAVYLAEGFRTSAITPYADALATANVYYPDGSKSLDSTTYKFAYDPVTDPLVPYVLVKVGSEPANGTIAGGAYLFDAFDSLTYGHNDGYIYKDGDNTTYRYGEIQGIGLGKSQYNIGGGRLTGSMLVVNYGNNKAVKYWVNPTEDYPVGTSRPIYHLNESNGAKDKPCIFIGSGTSVAGASNPISVFMVDLTTDTGVYPTIRFRVSSDMSMAKSPTIFLLQPSGTLGETTGLSDKSAIVKDTYVNPSNIVLTPGTWNRLAAIVDYANKLIHVYINDQYIGTVDGKALGSNINGFRLDLTENSTPVDSAIVLDNVVVAKFGTAPVVDAYSDLIYDGSKNKDNYFNVGGNSAYVNGKAYCNLDEALQAAAVTNSKVYLIDDITNAQVVRTNGTVISSGYNMVIDPESTGYKNVNGTYIFNSDYHVKYAFMTGTDADGEPIFANAEIGVNVVPTAPAGSIADKAYKKNEATGTYLVASLLGWSEDPTSTTPDDLAPVTMEDVERYDGQTLYLYPVYSAYSETGFLYVVIDTETGAFKRGGNKNHLWGSLIASEIDLRGGETLVICSNNIRWADGFAHQSSAIYNGSSKGEVCIDVNGFEMSLQGGKNDVRKITSFFTVTSNVTLNVYSSRAGGKITSSGLADSGIKLKSQWDTTNTGYKGVPADAYTAGASGGAMFIFRPATADHKSNNGNTNMNAHLNIGTYNNKYAGNLTLEGAAIVYADSGDKTCSINIDGTTLVRNSTDYTAGILTRYYYGDITVKNSNLYCGVNTAIIGADATVSTITEGVLTESPAYNCVIDNCVIIVKTNGGRILGNNTQSMGTITITNTVTNGTIEATSKLKSNVIIGEGVAAYSINPSAYADGIIPAAYNVPMTVEGVLDIPYIYVEATQKGTIKYEADIQSLVYKVVSNGSTETADLVLPVLAQKTVKAEDAVKVTFKGIGGNADTVVDYAKGGNVVAVAINDVTLNAVKLVFTGFDALPTNVQKDVTVTPTYEVKSNIEGVKVNLSIYSDFVINLYIPVAYENYIASITDGTDTLNTSKVTLEDGEYVKVVIKRASNEATLDAVFTINIVEGEYTKAVNVTVSIASYAEAILKGESYTAEDKQLMYYMLTYANEACKYFDKTENTTIAALLTTYADAKGEGMADQTYAKAIENLAFGTVITEATVNLGSAPAFVFTVAEGFEGTITVTYAGNTKELVVKDGKAIVNGMKVYNFGADVTVTAVGTVNGEAVNETATYNLDTFVKYHVNNDAPESVACVDLLKALYDYVTCADLYTKK